MKKSAGGVWVRKGVLPYYLKGHKLALALLLQEKPMSRAQLIEAITNKSINYNQKELDKMLTCLINLGVITLTDGIYTADSDKLSGSKVRYTEAQLLDLVGMTQGTVNGQAFYSAAPPMSVNSRGSSGT